MPMDRRSEKRSTVYRAEIPATGQLREVIYESLADALHFACRDLRAGRRRPLAIVEDGVVIYDAETIALACEEQRQRHLVATALG
jgi:hypothetical protein